jgi:hypothetical protein
MEEARKAYFQGIPLMTFNFSGMGVYLMEIEKNKQESTLIWTDRGRLVLGNLGEYHEALYGLFGPLKSQIHLVAESVQAVRAKFVSEGAQLEGRIHSLLPPPYTRNENEFSREGYLFRKRQKGIGAPWKRIYASLSINCHFLTPIIGPDGVFSQQSLHTKQRGLVEQVPNSSVNVLICQVHLQIIFCCIGASSKE